MVVKVKMVKEIHALTGEEEVKFEESFAHNYL
jgi:hypothetical protein